MKFQHTTGPGECAEILANQIERLLKQHKKVLWLISGGSNISIAVLVSSILNRNCKNDVLANLAITLSDERYGITGHQDSNWAQLEKAGFIFDSINISPVLQDLSFKETIILFSQRYRELSDWSDVVIAQLGIGQDGHIAGVLPNTVSVEDNNVVCGYVSEPYLRISLTLKTLSNIDQVYTFALGETKRGVLLKLKDDNLPLDKMPAQVLKIIKDSYLYSDQL